MFGEVGIGGLIALLVLLIVYCAPSIVATQRGYHNRQAILVLNLLLGWTVLGWIAALIWALTRPPSPSPNRTS
jgi:uncharacterized membrane protein YqaE (UPF0057 family)